MTAPLTKLCAETARLETQLRGLVKRHPDDGVEPDERIFNRILTNDWRPAVGSIHGPWGQRYWDAVNWVNDFDAYTGRIRELCAHQPEWLRTLPLTQRLRLSADELLHLLKVQREMLTQWAKDLKGSKPQGHGKKDHELRKLVQQFANELGMDELAAQIGCHRDTLSDFAFRDSNPQQKTMKKVRAYVLSQQAQRRS